MFLDRYSKENFVSTLGQTEAPLTIKPFLPEMTPSELHCVMTSGMATIAGSVLFAYIKFNISASHL